tara:strand:+ start:973 stop:2127 length:1155 start_codon:yes stop_codon:yes gene_type:complete
MSQHDFNIANQSFPATRTDLNNALVALASNSSGDAEPATKYANQWWYETDTNILKLRNEANNGWVDVITLDASMTATASELNQLDAITRGSILYGNASGETARLAAGAASTVLTSDGTDISWVTASSGGTPAVVFPSNWASPSETFNSSGTWSKGSLSDDDYVWFLMVGGGQGGGGRANTTTIARGGEGGLAMLLYGKAEVFNGGAYVIGSGGAGSTVPYGNPGGATYFTFLAANYVAGATERTTGTADQNSATPTAVTNVLELNKGVISSANYLSSSDATPHIFGLGVLPSNYTTFLKSSNASEATGGSALGSVFSGGGGCSALASASNVGKISLFSGGGGASSSSGSPSAGTFPGGGGGASSVVAGATGSAGAAGQIRVYHV